MQASDSREVTCYRCEEKGHISQFCLWKSQVKVLINCPHDEKMDCSFRCHKGPGHHNKPVVKVKVGDTIILAVVDMGCSQSMIQADFLLPHLGSLESPLSMICIHIASYTYKRRKVQLSLLGHTEEFAMGLAETLLCPMLLGVDWPYLEEVST